MVTVRYLIFLLRFFREETAICNDSEFSVKIGKNPFGQKARHLKLVNKQGLTRPSIVYKTWKSQRKGNIYFNRKHGRLLYEYCLLIFFFYSTFRVTTAHALFDPKGFATCLYFMLTPDNIPDILDDFLSKVFGSRFRIAFGINPDNGLGIGFP